MLKRNQKAGDKTSKKSLKKIKNKKVKKTINKEIKKKKIKKNKPKKEKINKKEKKEKMPLRLKIINNSKLLAKDLKRSRWVDIKENRKTFIKVSIFIVVIALALFGIAVGFGALWSNLGVGING